jgi:hypothetical protein
MPEERLNPWRLTNWQSDLVNRLPEEQREPAAKAFYYFGIVGSGSESFFTNLLVLLGACKYWSESLPQAIAGETDLAVGRIRDSTEDLVRNLRQFTIELQTLTADNRKLQIQLGTEQREVNNTLNQLWRRIADQLNNPRFAKVLGEDISRTFLAGFEQLLPQIHRSYEDMAVFLRQNSADLSVELRASSQDLVSAIETDAQTLVRTWQDTSKALGQDIEAARQAKLEIARSARDLRRFTEQVRLVRRWSLLLSALGLLLLGFFLGWLTTEFLLH